MTPIDKSLAGFAYCGLSSSLHSSFSPGSQLWAATASSVLISGRFFFLWPMAFLQRIFSVVVVVELKSASTETPMPTKVPHSTSQPQPSSAMPPTRSRPGPSAATPNVAGQPLAHSSTGHLAAMAAMVNQSPRVQAQFKLAHEIRNSHPVQRLRNVAAAIQMKEGVPINDDPILENEAGVMGNKAMEVGDKPIQEKVAALSPQQYPADAIQL